MLRLSSFSLVTKLIVFFVTLSTIVYSAPVVVQPGVDLWFTQSDCQSSELSFADNPIPADFFDPGSDPFAGSVKLQGQPLQTNPPNVLDPTDIIVNRLGQLNLPTIGSTDQIPIEIISLSLVSCEPITVINGTSTENWQVQVNLSNTFPQQQGVTDVSRDCEKGGIFHSIFTVTPRFIFTRIDGPFNSQVELNDGIPRPVETFGSWSTDPPPFANPLQSTGAEQVDHDNDPITPDIVVPPSSPNFFAGVRNEPCSPTATSLCSGISSVTNTGLDLTIICIPPMMPITPIGATCLGDGSCIITEPSCASLITDAIYQGDGSICDAFSCFPPPMPGIILNQVDFVYNSSFVPLSSWGRLEIDVATLSLDQGLTSGFVNMYTDLGWAVQNLWFDATDGINEVTTYFQIAPADGSHITNLSAHVLVTSSPLDNFNDDIRSAYSVTPVMWNAEGREAPVISLSDEPLAPGTITFDVLGITEVLIQPNKSNVQTADNQCFPMSIANSLQYLEDRYGLPIPQSHVKGLKGDASLVGHLGAAANRAVVDRAHGSPVGDGQMMTGKFKYLKDNDLKKKLVTKHQGGFIPVGDFTAHGSTSKDQSVNGKVTWQWICDELAKGEDVEACWTYYDKLGNSHGGHAVRIFECGRTLGIPWIGYVHDRNQTSSDSTDTLGLECVQALLIDLDGDSIPNVGSKGRELDFAISESADTDMDGVTNGVDNAPNTFNPGQEDYDGNGIGDVIESSDLIIDEIPSFDLTAGGTIDLGPFPNPAPPGGNHKDMWYLGTATASNASSTRVIVSFDYIGLDEIPVNVPPKDTTVIPAGKTFDVFGSILLDFCPVAVSVHFEALDGPALNITGGLRHICYSPLDITCCIGTVGDANMSGELTGEVSVGDIAIIVDFLFGSGSPLPCILEADVNQTGGLNPTGADISVGDIADIVDNLFGSGAPLPDCF